MRSSIACLHCRRSKVKCVNNGIHAPCRACTSQSRDCIYHPPTTTFGSGSKRRESMGGLKADGENVIKRMRKKDSDTTRRLSIRSNTDALESPQISVEQWTEIYRLFTLHFSTDLPFLHKRTFFDRVIKSQQCRSAEDQIFFLGILTLTARFVDDLVKYPSYPQPATSRSGHKGAKPGHPLYPSEFYARALEDRLDAVTLSKPSLETIQSLLMLGYYNWGMCRGTRSWIYIGHANRLAFAMGFHKLEKSVSHVHSTVSTGKDDEVGRELRIYGFKEKDNSVAETENLVLREIKRRTMWSCFILDRWTSDGDSRPQMSVESLTRLRLPCSEDSFQWGADVKTDFLRNSGMTTKIPNISNNSVTDQIAQALTLYIRLTDVWGNVSKWSCAGGRREEKHPPWDKKTEFHKLQKQLDDYEASLPPILSFSPINLANHVSGQTRSLYCTIHTCLALCHIIMHREYIPFIPLLCLEGPEGPLDEPTFRKDKFKIPEGYWENSAAKVFKNARIIMDIVKAMESLKFLIETPPLIFAIGTAASVGVYARHFQWMDPGRYMCDSPDSIHSSFDHGGDRASSLALNVLGKMKVRTKQAANWHKLASTWNRYFQGFRADHEQKRSIASHEQTSTFKLPDPRKIDLREGGSGMGGGLAMWEKIENDLKPFGTIDDDDDSTFLDSDRYERGASRATTSGPEILNHENHACQKIEGTSISRPGSERVWTAVNSSSPGNHAQRLPSSPYKLQIGLSPQGSSFGSYDTAPGPSGSDVMGYLPDRDGLSNISRQHSNHLSVFPSSAQHTHPVPGLGVETSQAHYPFNHHQSFRSIGTQHFSFGAGDLDAFRDGRVFVDWEFPELQSYPNFMGNPLQQNNQDAYSTT